MIKVTDNAKNRFRQQLKEKQHAVGIRLGVTKTGCSGYAYKVEFASEWKNDDCLCIYDNDLYIWVTEEAYKYLNGMTVDYVKQGLNERFEFINPNEVGRCGCGESFTV
jgi:iron-sulfur cluster assembly protein